MISIHVPVLGTTFCSCLQSEKLSISIHVPVLGTTKSEISIILRKLFQSTFPCWERLLLMALDGLCEIISIHVPVLGTTYWLHGFVFIPNISIHVPVLGTTLLSLRTRELVNNFNPRSRVGNDSKYV